MILYNRGAALMQVHERKGRHGTPVTAGEWLDDNRLGMASVRGVKLSKPIPQGGSAWESSAKFRLTGWLSRVPKQKVMRSAPTRLSFSPSSRGSPLASVNVGGI